MRKLHGKWIMNKYHYRHFKKDFCEKCGFKSKFLDIHHIDGNHQNNELPNLQTLCTACHRNSPQTYKKEMVKIV